MTKEKLEEKIKNNESVFDKNGEVIDFKEYEEDCGADCGRFGRNVEWQKNGVYISVYGDDNYYYFYKFDEIFTTKAQAQHYLDNGNVLRTEKLPYVTWEEFKKGKYIKFNSPQNNEYKLLIEGDCILIEMAFLDENNEWDFDELRYDLNEENFYKAYEVCRKLFKGEDCGKFNK